MPGVSISHPPSGSFNISLNVVQGSTGKQKFRQIVQFINLHRGESGIIYCLRRKDTENMAEKLTAAGIPWQDIVFEESIGS